MRLFCLSVLLFIVISHCHAQQTDPLLLEEQQDSLYTDSPPELTETTDYSDRFDPRKASLYSAILPGLGQAYNRSYWKIPLVYGGFVAFGLTIDFFHDNHARFREDLFAEVDDSDITVNTSGFNEGQLRRLVDRTRRDRDFYILMAGVFYLLQIAEAHIDAHLKEFKFNPDLQVRVEPVIRNSGGLNSGIALTLKF